MCAKLNRNPFLKTLSHNCVSPSPFLNCFDTQAEIRHRLLMCGACRDGGEVFPTSKHSVCFALVLWTKECFQCWESKGESINIKFSLPALNSSNSNIVLSCFEPRKSLIFGCLFPQNKVGVVPRLRVHFKYLCSLRKISWVMKQDWKGDDLPCL